MRLANRGRGHPMFDKSFKYGKEEIKWQKKESLRPTFQREPATRARHSVAVIGKQGRSCNVRYIGGQEK